jgi:hypothetical protein
MGGLESDERGVTGAGHIRVDGRFIETKRATVRKHELF